MGTVEEVYAERNMIMRETEDRLVDLMLGNTLKAPGKLRGRLNVFLTQVQRKLNFMKDSELEEQMKTGKIQFCGYWSPIKTLMTITEEELPDEEITKEREEKPSRKSTQSVEEGRACTHTL